MTSGKRRILALVFAAGVGVLGTYAYLSREPLLEIWWLHRFERSELEEKRSAIAVLAEIGGARTARKLSELLAVKELEREAIAAMIELAPRLQPASRVLFVRSLIDRLNRRGARMSNLARKAVVEIGGREEAALPEFFAALAAKNEALGAIAARMILLHFEKGSERAKNILRRSGPKVIQRFFFRSDATGDFPPRGAISAENLGEAVAVAEWLEGSHGDARVRALALSFQVFRGMDVDGFTYDAGALRRAWERRGDREVRRAAVRLAGYIGPGTLDLSRILLEEEDPGLLTEAIEARTLWSGCCLSPYALGWVELADGILCSWVPQAEAAARRKPWEDRELERLSELLATSKDERLRDAASLALASRYRALPSPPRPQQSRRGLRVHEWAVFRDRTTALAPHLPEGLPPFVHRSRVRTQEIQSYHFERPVLKPVVYFYAPDPACVLFQVGFFRGRPWTFYPKATDYTHESGLLPTGRGGFRGLPEGRPVSEVAILSDRPSITPDWLLGGTAPSFAPPPAVPQSLDTFHHVAPWVRPLHPQSVAAANALRVLTDIGLEWCGLRVGARPPLEGEVREVEPDSWWARLRDVPSDWVAVRGERERFLFYEGAVNLPAPVRIAWTSPRKKELLLQVRPFEEGSEGGASGGDGAGQARPGSGSRIPAIVVLRREGGALRGAVRESLSSGDTGKLPLGEIELEETAVRERLQALLEEGGLTPAEAVALLAAWEREFFETPGLRVLTLLPRSAYDAVLPARVFPAPEEFVRVGLVWRECDDLRTDAGGWGWARPREEWEPRRWPLRSRPEESAAEPLLSPREEPAAMEDGAYILPPGAPAGLALSTDGGRAVIGLLRGGAYEIFLLDRARKVIERLARVPAMAAAGGISLSADHGLIAFGVERDSGPRGFIVDRRAKRRIDLGAVEEPAISADGRWLICKEGGGVIVRDLVAGVARVVLGGADSEAARIGGIAISSDGATAAFVRDGRVYVVALERSLLLDDAQRGAGAVRLSWDGERVLFERAPGAGSRLAADEEGRRVVFDPRGGRELMSVDLDAGTEREIAGSRDALAFALSADGRVVAFVTGGASGSRLFFRRLEW